MTDYETEIARRSLDIGAIKLSPEKPFQWASGYFMPIYNDNRMHLFHPQNRTLIANAFSDVIKQVSKQESRVPFEVIAGTSTAGIAPAALLAHMAQLPLVYVRDKPKEHGLRNMIEGLDADKDFEGKRVLVIEDLISTGGSSVKTVQAVRDANGSCDHCFSIFNYGLKEAQDMFAGTVSYDKKSPEQPKLNPACNVTSLVGYDRLLEIAIETGYLKPEQIDLLREWREDPFKWGEKHGFPQAKK